MANTKAHQNAQFSELEPAGPKPSDYGRPRSIEELSNRYLVHPLAARVAKIAISLKLSANFVSFAGLGAGLLAAVFYYYQAQILFIVAGFLLMVLWHVFDGADGKVARATGTSSPLGRIIDGICDHLVFGAVYFAFVFYLLGSGASQTVWFWAIAAAISHGVQAAGYEERRQKFQRRSRGITRQGVQEKLLSVNGRRSILALGYDNVQKLVSPRTTRFDTVLDGLWASHVPVKHIQSVVNRTRIIVRAWALLNANNRTIMLAITALFGRPELYFVYEAVVLNIVFVILVFYEHFKETRMAADLDDTLDMDV